MNSNIYISGLVVLWSLSSCSESSQKSELPNIVYILADDLGYGDISCLGQSHFQTPNIDRLVSQGMLFTEHYAGSSVSAPSRSTLLTGQHTGHTPIRGNKPGGDEGQMALPADSYTVMEMLKESGYTTAVMGKWGLGSPSSEGDPNNQGVDEFFGYNCQRLAHHYYPYHLWDNQQMYPLEGNAGHHQNDYAPYIIHNRAKEFISDNQDTPFFLFYASILPHAELLVPEVEIAPFRGKYPPEKSYKGVDSGEQYRQGPYGSQSDAHAAFAAMVVLLDRQIGDIVDHIDELGLMDNTLIIVSTDNGPHREGGADPEYFNSNGELRGFKRDLYEGGIRVPMIARWSGRIAAGSSSDHVSAFWDFLPTVAEIVGITPKSDIDGISFLPSLLKEDQRQAKHDYLYWEFHEMGGRQAVRYGDWKGVKYDVSRGGEIELYDLSKDIGETINVAAQNPEVVAKIENILSTARTPSTDFKFASETLNSDTKQ